jgi:hypothetical protein
MVKGKKCGYYVDIIFADGNFIFPNDEIAELKSLELKDVQEGMSVTVEKCPREVPAGSRKKIDSWDWVGQTGTVRTAAGIIF